MIYLAFINHLSTTLTATAQAVTTDTTLKFELSPENSEQLVNLCGQFDAHLRQIEEALEVEIHNRGFEFNIKGTQQRGQTAINVLQELYQLAADEVISKDTIHLITHQYISSLGTPKKKTERESRIRTKRKVVRGRGVQQNTYIDNIQRHNLAFGVGPAGTGKTYLAVACAVEALERDEVRRIILVRPAVEAGERLGFLPGDLSQKIDPYLRPMYDALYEFMGIEKVNKLIEKHVIEVAPLAYMRGRTLNDAFIIMDEAQNSTVEQMKMFLTRLGFGSSAVVTGDITQIDLPTHQRSGLKHVIEILDGVKGISFTQFSAKDVVRHTLVQRIVEAYDEYDKTQ